MTKWPDIVVKVAKAISVAEGFGPPEAIPTRANNPGDLTGQDAGSFRILGTMNTEGVVHFVNLDDGWEALFLKVNRLLSGKSHIFKLADTLEAVGRKYSGSDDGAWAKNVAAELGVPVTATLGEIAES